MFNVTNSGRRPTMTKSEPRPALAVIKDLIAAQPDSLREVVRAVMQEMLEAEMTDALGAEKGERTPARLGTAPATTRARSSLVSASSSCGCRRTATAASRP